MAALRTLVSWTSNPRPVRLPTCRWVTCRSELPTDVTVALSGLKARLRIDPL
jgi:hypothetical protein